MNDIVFDTNVRDILFAPDGDFLLTSNPSVQNGSILLQARCMNILQPQFGIGYNSQVLGSDETQAAFQLNRWIAQINSDNGTGSWIKIPNPPNVNFDFNGSVNYLGT